MYYHVPKDNGKFSGSGWLWLASSVFEGYPPEEINQHIITL